MQAAERGTRNGVASEQGDVVPLTIVIPAYNEATRLEIGVDRLASAVSDGAVDPGRTEIVVVDDGSTDDTAARATDLFGPFGRTQVVRLPRNSGKGAAVRAGVARASGANVAFMDADMAIDPRQIPSMTEALGCADLAIGARSLPESSAENDTWVRTATGWAFNRIVNTATHVALGDTQCGFKAFRTPVARLLFHATVVDGFAFDVEILWLARLLGLRIAEVPVRWRNAKGSRIRPIRDPLTMMADMAKSRAGLRVPQPIEAALVTPGGGRSALERARRVVDRTTPVVPWTADRAAVLLPLRAPAEIDLCVGQMTDALGSPAVRRVSLTVPQLVAAAPLAVSSGTSA